jgi:hypothetical protein
MNWLKAKKTEYDPKQLETGKDIEKEHKNTIQKLIDDVRVNKIQPMEYYYEMIAKDHLGEFNDYYTHLVKMENELKKENK